MKFKVFVFLVAIVVAAWSTKTALGQIVLPPRIENLNNETIIYCSDSVLVAPFILINNVEINEESEGMKISIANYKPGEDVLTFKKHPKFDYFWDSNYGSLLIRGIGKASEYQEAVRNVFYKNMASVPNLEIRSFSISLLDADYLPDTRHFYRYIKSRGIKWTDARNYADTLNYYGLKGYLATITSKNENDFIWTKIDGVGWIGASDSLSEGTWKWVTGPERGTIFWQGNYNGFPVNGQYSFWNSGEPNNVQKSWGDDEDYAHSNSNPNTIPKSWNDLPNEGDKNNPDGYYFPQGFIVEFGGMQGDPVVKLSATAKIQISKIAFSEIREFTICEGQSQELNLVANEHYKYSWSPVENISAVSVSNPLVTPRSTTVYQAVGKLDQCTDTAYFTVHVNPKPEHLWEKVNTICPGTEIELDPGEHTTYLWENMESGRTLKVSEEGYYTVKITNEFGCSNKDSAKVNLAEMPRLNYSEIDTLVCGAKSQEIKLSFQNGNASTLLTSITPGSTIVDENTPTPTITVNEFGEYLFQMDLVDQYQCSFSDTLKIGFHNQPEARFQINDADCEGYNIKLYYTGSTYEDAWYDWYSSDTLFFSGINADTMEIPLGFGTFNRSVGLMVNEKGCTASIKLPVTVTPVLDFWVENASGCTPLPVQFNYSASEPVQDFFWDFGDGVFSSEMKPAHVYNNPGKSNQYFNVQLKIISSEGCENKGILENAVTVYPIPDIDFNFSENECSSNPATIWYKGSATENDSYFWDLTGFGKEEVLNNPRNSAGPLVLDLKNKPLAKIGLQLVSEYGCKTDSLFKTIKRKPLFDVQAENTEGCPPLHALFTASPADEIDQLKYIWDFGDGSTQTGYRVEKSYFEEDKKYNLSVIANSGLTGCTDTLFFENMVYSYPVPRAFFQANPSTALISNPRIQFMNESKGAKYYLWDFGDDSPQTGLEDPEHVYNKMGFFDAILAAQNEIGCIDTFIQQVSVAFDKLFPPTAFSPNDILPENREFRIYSEGILDEGYRFTVFNRWGEIIFQSNNQLHGWDGKMKNGNYAPAGVYTWTLEYCDFRRETFKQQGTVTLLF